MSKKVIMYCSYDFKIKGSYLKLSEQYINSTDKWKLEFINEVLDELENEKKHISKIQDTS